MASKQSTFSPSFARFWYSQLISSFGDSLTGIALVWILMELTDSTLARGITLSLSVLPSLLLAPVVASLIDRFNRKHLMVYSDIARFVLDILFILILRYNALAPWHVYAFSVSHAMVRVLYLPCTTALVPMLMPHDSLLRANGAQELSRHVAMVAGPLIGGAALSRLGPIAVVSIDGLTFLASAFLLRTIDVEGTHKEGRSQDTFGQQIQEGFKYIRSNAWILHLTLAFILINMAGAIVSVLLPFLVRDQTPIGPIAYGYVTAAAAFGSVLVSLLLSTRIIRVGNHQLLTVSATFLALLTTLLAGTKGLWFLVAINFLVGSCGPVMIAASNTAYQTNVPQKLLGRVTVFRRTASTALQPLVFLATGLLGDSFAHSTSLLLAALVTGAAALLIYSKAKVPEKLPDRVVS